MQNGMVNHIYGEIAEVLGEILSGEVSGIPI